MGAAKLRWLVEANIEWEDGRPESATIAMIGATAAPVQVLAAGASLPLRAVQADLPAIALPHGWRVVLVPVAVEGAREIERLRGGG